MRETDDAVVRRARIFIDTRQAVAEAGDILQPMQEGMIGSDSVLGELADLCRGTVRGRTAPEDITSSSRSAPPSRTWPPPWRCTSITSAPGIREQR
jgi:hypothetical protein